MTIYVKHILMGTEQLRKHIQKILFESFLSNERPSLKQPVMPKPETPRNWQSVIDEEKKTKSTTERKSKSQPTLKTK